MRGRRLHIETRDEDGLGAGDTVIGLQYHDQNKSVQLSPPLEWTTPLLTKKHRLKRIFSLKKIRRTVAVAGRWGQIGCHQQHREQVAA